MERMKELTVPGRYRAPAFTEYSFAHEERLPRYARVDHMMHAPLEIEIDGDGIFDLSFEGASKWGWHSMNCTPSAMQGAIWVLLSQLIFYNDKVNDGAYFATRTHFPQGTWTNPDNEMAATGIAWFFLIPGFTGMFRLLGRAFQSRATWRRCFPATGSPATASRAAGSTHFGKEGATTNFEMSCVGTGGGTVRDGLDFAAAMWNPEGDMGDPEVWELLEPFIYLGRRIKPCTAGPGKYRGGSGYESLRMCWKTPYYELQNISGGKVFPSPASSAATRQRRVPQEPVRHERARTGETEGALPAGDGMPAESQIESTSSPRRPVRQADRHPARAV